MTQSHSDEPSTFVSNQTELMKKEVKGKKRVGLSKLGFTQQSNTFFSLLTSALLLLMFASIGLSNILEHQTWQNNTDFALNYLQEQPKLAEKSLRVGFQLGQFSNTVNEGNDQKVLQNELAKTLVRMAVYHQLLLDEYYLPHHKKTTGLFMPQQTHHKLHQALFQETTTLTSGVVSHYTKLMPKRNTPSMAVINTYSTKVYSQFFKQLSLVSMIATQAQKEERTHFQNQMGMLFLTMLILSAAFGLSLNTKTVATDGSLTNVTQRINGLLNEATTEHAVNDEQHLVKR